MIEKIKQIYGKIPKVLCGCPTNLKKSYILERYVSRLKELTYPNIELVLSDNSADDSFKLDIEKLGIKCLKSPWHEKSRFRIMTSRNQLRQYALDNGFDFYMSIEADVIPPVDIIEKLLIHNKDLVGGWYYIGDPNYARPCVSQEWKEVGNDKVVQAPPTQVVMAKNRLMKAFLGSMGIMLISRNVLEKIKFRVLDRFSHHDDTWFFFDCEDNGFELWIDTDLLVVHLQQPQQWANEIL